MIDPAALIAEALEEARTFLADARPLLGLAVGNSLGARADLLYPRLAEAKAELVSFGVRAPREERADGRGEHGDHAQDVLRAPGRAAREGTHEHLRWRQQ